MGWPGGFRCGGASVYASPDRERQQGWAVLPSTEASPGQPGGCGGCLWWLWGRDMSPGQDFTPEGGREADGQGGKKANNLA